MQSAVFSFVQATRTQRVSYRDQHEQLRGALSRHPVFRQGRILDTLERGGTSPGLPISPSPFSDRSEHTKTSKHEQEQANDNDRLPETMMAPLAFHRNDPNDAKSDSRNDSPPIGTLRPMQVALNCRDRTSSQAAPGWSSFAEPFPLRTAARLQRRSRPVSSSIRDHGITHDPIRVGEIDWHRQAV